MIVPGSDWWLPPTRDIDLRQNYNRNAKQLLAQQSRYAHAQQMKRAGQCTRKLKTYLGRVIRDLGRKCPHPDEPLQSLLEIGTRIFYQKRNDRHKIYSVHEPAVECISKGKAHKRYEFGCKVSVAATSRGGWFVGAKAIHGNPYDGHTLPEALEQVERIVNSPSRCSWIWVTAVTITPDPLRFMSTNDVAVEPPKASGVG